MSVSIMAKVWSDSQHKGNALLLLLAIADNADDEGYCWPGIEYLAKKVKASVSTVLRLTKQLEESKELFVVHNRRTGNRYVVRLALTQSQFAGTLRSKFSFDDETITSILLHSTCDSSELSSDNDNLQNDSSELSHVTEESSRTINQPPLNHQSPGATAPEQVHSEPKERCGKCGLLTETGPGAPTTADVCTCRQEAEAAAFFGERDKPVLDPPGDWRDRLRNRPWLGWSVGKFRPCKGISVESLERVGWLLERITTLVPVDGEYKAWGVGCAAIYQAGRGEFDIIEAGIRAAWNRLPKEARFRPTTAKGTDNGFAKAVKMAWADAQQKRRPRETIEPPGRDALRAKLAGRTSGA